ncbi:hypothetical protein [Rubrivirga sp. IMCC43871]|uniref:hypothetical protein n=1 Tax=Rubrivirga sp. IMCC43871 TaxID=3391575 RepID=UPI0039901CB7
MILRRLTQHVRDQNWTAVAIDFVIVVVGVFIGTQVANWNAERLDQQRRDRIADALVTDLRSAIAVQNRFVPAIDAGLAAWGAAHERGEQPAPFTYRIEGSDTAPDTWTTIEQMGLADQFDPVTLFDLTYYYSELEGVGRRYVRYVTFVEDEVLPGEIRGAASFYAEDGRLRPRFQANMDRLREYRWESERLTEWAECLVYRLGADRTFDQTCRHVDFRLDGMPPRPRDAEETP